MNEIQLVAKLYKCRDACKKLWGAEWRDKISFHTCLIRGAMEKYKINNEIEAAIKLVNDLKKSDRSGIFKLKCFAAAVELVEPSKD